MTREAEQDHASLTTQLERGLQVGLKIIGARSMSELAPADCERVFGDSIDYWADGIIGVDLPAVHVAIPVASLGCVP
jgi:small ligand-binding sensory domain FIST